MVSLWFWLVLGVVTPGAGPALALAAGSEMVAGPDAVEDVDSEALSDSDPAVRTALKSGGYRWYDAKTDSARPLWPPKPPKPSTNFRWLGWLSRLGARDLGELLITGLVILALAMLLVVLVELWRRYRPIEEEPARRVAVVGSAVPIESLPAGVRPETDDPWSEALRRREQGDLAGAVVLLFAHQLLTLSRRRLLHLGPGRTGRQLVRSIADQQFRRAIEPTLRMFEAVYYGRLSPSPEAFDAVWAQAEAFERLAAAGPAS